ncbi:MAG: alanyl-tRNA editing protein [Chloroflexota bacterium]
MGTMSLRLYYDDAYLTEFTAHVTARLEIEGQPAVVLDRSCFYPTSGGQPHDQGWLNETAVTNVTLHPDHGLLHWLASPLSTDRVNGRIDWPRRFDHMQQHTGQHLLSQAFIQVAQAETVGFHLTADNLTIDLNSSDLTETQIETAERLANQIIWENRPVSSRLVTPEQARQMALRKLPDVAETHIRLIEIEHFDTTACGGTHVARTGAVGLVKVVKQERRGSQQRLTFVCGRRALNDYGHKHQVIDTLMNRLTTAAEELDPTVARLQEEGKQAKRQLKRQAEQLVAAEAERLLQTAFVHNKLRIIKQVFTNRDPNYLRQLAGQLAQHESVIVLLGLAGIKSQLVFARAGNTPGAMDQLLIEALAIISPDARGGGSSMMAQGGGPGAAPALVKQALDRAQQILFDTL